LIYFHSFLDYKNGNLDIMKTRANLNPRAGVATIGAIFLFQQRFLQEKGVKTTNQKNRYPIRDLYPMLSHWMPGTCTRDHVSVPHTYH
jgi:hypothetical protein